MMLTIKALDNQDRARERLTIPLKLILQIKKKKSICLSTCTIMFQQYLIQDMSDWKSKQKNNYGHENVKA